MSANQFTITHEKINTSSGLIKFIGELTSDASHQLSKQVMLINQHSYDLLTLDFSELNRIDGTGLKHFGIFLTQIRRSELSLVAYGLSNEIRSIFQLTYLDELIKLG